MAKQNGSWIIIHYSQIMPVEGIETHCSSSSQDAVRVFWLRAGKGQGGRNPPVKAATNPVKAPTLCSFCKFILPWEQSQLPGSQWRSQNCTVFHKSTWAHKQGRDSSAGALRWILQASSSNSLGAQAPTPRHSWDFGVEDTWAQRITCLVDIYELLPFSVMWQ